jgi:LacI family transcriptional regulator
VQTFTRLGVEHNYEILLSSLPQDARLLEIAGRQMIECRVDGVAILAFGREESLIELLTRGEVPIVAVDIDAPAPLLKTLRIDYQQGIRQAVQHLAALGHRRIAFITGPAYLKTATMRKIAFLECMKEIGLVMPPQLVVEGDHTMEAGMKAMSIFSALPDRPSAVFCSNDMTAIGVMRQAFEVSLSIPRDLSIIGFDDIRLAQFMIPPLTTVQMSQTEIAELAFRALVESVRSQGERSSREVFAIKTNLMLRRSTTLAPHRVKELAPACATLPVDMH